MNAQEFREEFNLRYNNALGEAPGLDIYEISTYLTRAQLEIVRKYYDASINPQSAFELTERSRRAINELVKVEKISETISSERGIASNSIFYEIPNSVMFILTESLIINGLDVGVVPIITDEYLVSKDSPFKKPNKRRAWRLDISKENSKTTVEIIAHSTPSLYNVRYLSFPSPIIVGDLTDSNEDGGGLGLTIDGNTSVATSVLNDFIHPEIINRAVELATLDYRDNSLQARVSLDERN